MAHRPLTLRCNLAQSAIGIDHNGMADCSQHGLISDGIRVRKAFGQVELALFRYPTHLHSLVFASAEELRFTREEPIADLQLGGHHVVDTERPRNGLNNLPSRCRDNEHLMPPCAVCTNELQGLGVDVRRDVLL